jgi:integrase/recombinase XerD
MWPARSRRQAATRDLRRAGPIPRPSEALGQIKDKKRHVFGERAAGRPPRFKEKAGMTFTPTDRLALGALEATLAQARSCSDERPALEVLAGSLVELGVRATPSARSIRLLARDRDAWLRRLQSAERGESTVSAYRIAIDDLIAWAGREGRSEDLFDEQGIVDYLDDYRRGRNPAPATYYRRFVLLRRFMQWLSRRHGTPDPFLELQAPAKPQQERDWLTHEEFAAMLAAAEHPPRIRPGLIQRDRLVLMALVLTGLRREELIAVEWHDVTLEGEHPSLLVRRGKGGKPRRQPLPTQLVAELEHWRLVRNPAASDPVFCGLAGRRLQGNVLADVIRRSARRARLAKHVTAHTLRHTAATWLRQATGDTRLVAEYLGHADLSTVSRYAHVTSRELQSAVQTLADQAAMRPPTSATDRAPELHLHGTSARDGRPGACPIEP